MLMKDYSAAENEYKQAVEGFPKDNAEKGDWMVHLGDAMYMNGKKDEGSLHRFIYLLIALCSFIPYNYAMTSQQPFHCVEGIILKVIPFGDYDQILSLFTAETGLIKLFMKGSRSRKRGLQGICIPLTGVQVVYKEKNSELFSGHEMTLIESYRFLRSDLNHLNAACTMLNALESTQLPCKPAPQLYALLLYFLARIPDCADLAALTSSFRLKLLRHEGLIAFPLECLFCQAILKEKAFHFQGESFCEPHRTAGTIEFDEEEIRLLEHLATCQSFQGIATIVLSDQFKGKFNFVFT